MLKRGGSAADKGLLVDDIINTVMNGGPQLQLDPVEGNDYNKDEKSQYGFALRNTSLINKFNIKSDKPFTIGVGWGNFDSWNIATQKKTSEKFALVLTNDKMDEVGLKQSEGEINGEWISAIGSKDNPAKFNDEAIIP